MKENEKQELQDQKEKQTQLWESQENQRIERWMERQISGRPRLLSLRLKTCWNWFLTYSAPILFRDNWQLRTGHWNQNTKQTFWYLEYQKCLSEVLGRPSSLSPDFCACYPPSALVQLFQPCEITKMMGPSKSQYHPHKIGVHCHCSSRDAFGLILLNSSNFINKTSLYKSSQMRKNCKSPLLLRIILLETESPNRACSAVRNRNMPLTGHNTHSTRRKSCLGLDT